MTEGPALDAWPAVFSSPELAAHAPDAFPETAERLSWAIQGVELAWGIVPETQSGAGGPAEAGDSCTARRFLRAGIAVPTEPLPPARLELVHSREYLDFLAGYAAQGGGMLSVDTKVTEGSYRAAALASSAAWLGVEQSVQTGRPSLALVRPPGHHAGIASGMGFCLVNHAAVAARLFQVALPGGPRRVAIVDWDVHHGNGTAAVFAADPDCLYVSIHESPLYPYTGWYTEAGTGPGEGTTVNLPLPGSLTDEQAVEAFQRVVVPCIAAYRPELILVSAGFDGHWSDQISTWQLTANGYHALTAAVRETARAAGLPVVVLLEGGYTPAAVRLGVAAVAAGLAGRRPHAAAAADEPRSGPASRRQAAAFRERLDEIASFQRRYWGLG